MYKKLLTPDTTHEEYVYDCTKSLGVIKNGRRHSHAKTAGVRQPDRIFHLEKQGLSVDAKLGCGPGFHPSIVCKGPGDNLLFNISHDIRQVILFPPYNPHVLADTTKHETR